MIAFQVPHPTEPHDVAGHGPVTFRGVHAFLGDPGDEDRRPLIPIDKDTHIDAVCSMLSAADSVPWELWEKMTTHPRYACSACNSGRHDDCPGVGYLIRDQVTEDDHAHS